MLSKSMGENDHETVYFEGTYKWRLATNICGGCSEMYGEHIASSFCEGCHVSHERRSGWRVGQNTPNVAQKDRTLCKSPLSQTFRHKFIFSPA